MLKPVGSVLTVQSVSPYLPVWVVFVVAARHGTDVRFLGGQVGRNPLLEVDPGEVVLQVTVRVLGGGLEFADRTDLDGVGSRIFSWFKTKLLSMESLTKGAQAGCAPPVLHSVLPRGGW